MGSRPSWGWWERRTPTMPPIETLSAPPLTPGHAIGLALLRSNLLVALVFIVVRIVQSAA